MSGFVLLPWELVIMRKEDIILAKIVQSVNGKYGIELVVSGEYSNEKVDYWFSSKRKAAAMLEDLHERLNR